MDWEKVDLGSPVKAKYGGRWLDGTFAGLGPVGLLRVAIEVNGEGYRLVPKCHVALKDKE